MSRVKLLPEFALEETIRGLKADSLDLKDVQYMGADVLAPKSNATGNAYDLTSVDDGFGDQIITTIVTLSANTQPNVSGSFTARFYDMSGNELSQLDFVRIFVTPLAELPDSGEARVDLSAQRAGTNPFQCKIYFLATDTGTLTFS